jgi:hypothetical protein
MSRRILGRSLAFLAIFLSIVAFVPVFPGAATYESVGLAKSDTIGRPVRGSTEFMIRNGKLYLLRQRTWHAFLITTFVQHIEWREVELERLRSRFPELSDGTW